MHACIMFKSTLKKVGIIIVDKNDSPRLEMVGSL
jgi:hypothetical protein